MPNTLVGLPPYYAFPFDDPDGIAYNIENGDPTPYHELCEKEVVVFIKSHHRGFPSLILLMKREDFNQQYTTDPDYDPHN